MTEKTNKIVKYSSIGLIVLGGVGAYLAGITESTSTSIIAGVFVFAAIITNAIKS